MLDIYSMRQIYWANQDKGNWELSCWKAKVLLSIPQSSSCWIRRARQKVELADETIAKLLQCLRWSCFWGLWTYLGGYLWLCREHKWLRLWNCDRSREIQDPYFCLNSDKLDLLLGMLQVEYLTLLIGDVLSSLFLEWAKCWLMGYLAAGPGKEGFNVFYF